MNEASAELNIVIQEFAKQQSIREAQYQSEKRLRDLERQGIKRNVVLDLEPKLRIAKLDSYLQWLKGFLQTGGEPTHFYDYPFGRWQDGGNASQWPHAYFFVANKDFTMYPLHGSRSIGVIVPESVRYLGGELGHSTLYLHEGHKTLGLNLVPIFTDVKF